jgi:hypothetical protein
MNVIFSFSNQFISCHIIGSGKNSKICKPCCNLKSVLDARKARLMKRSPVNMRIGEMSTAELQEALKNSMKESKNRRTQVIRMARRLKVCGLFILRS